MSFLPNHLESWSPTYVHMHFQKHKKSSETLLSAVNSKQQTSVADSGFYQNDLNNNSVLGNSWAFLILANLG